MSGTDRNGTIGTSSVTTLRNFQKGIIDREEEDGYIGRTEFDSPEVDPEVIVFKEHSLKPGEFYNVNIEESQAFDLYGKVLL